MTNTTLSNYTNSTSSTFNPFSCESVANGNSGLPSTGSGKRCLIVPLQWKSVLRVWLTLLGISYAKACDALSQTYQLSSFNYVWNGTTTYEMDFTSSFFNYYTYTSYFYPSAYTLCDGIPHVSGSATSTSISTSSAPDVDISPEYGAYCGPKPTCTIDRLDCQAIWSSYNVASSSIDASYSSALATNRSAAITSYATAPMVCSNCGKCTIFGGKNKRSRARSGPN